MLLSQATIFATDLDISSASSNPGDKLTGELKEVMSNTPDDEYISIYIWLKVYSDESVYYLLSRELGENITKETPNFRCFLIYFKKNITKLLKKCLQGI